VAKRLIFDNQSPLPLSHRSTPTMTIYGALDDRRLQTSPTKAISAFFDSHWALGLNAGPGRPSRRLSGVR
jgi:hypothetical protein